MVILAPRAQRMDLRGHVTCGTTYLRDRPPCQSLGMTGLTRMIHSQVGEFDRRLGELD